jgi:hypothetical protein
VVSPRSASEFGGFRCSPRVSRGCWGEPTSGTATFGSVDRAGLDDGYCRIALIACNSGSFRALQRLKHPRSFETAPATFGPGVGHNDSTTHRGGRG